MKTKIILTITMKNIEYLYELIGIQKFYFRNHFFDDIQFYEHQSDFDLRYESNNFNDLEVKPNKGIESN